MEWPPARVRAMVSRRRHAERTRPGLRLSLVAQHQTAPVAERSGVELRGARQRLEYDLDRSRSRHRVRLALASRVVDGRKDPANSRGGDGALTRPGSTELAFGRHILTDKM